MGTKLTLEEAARAWQCWGKASSAGTRWWHLEPFAALSSWLWLQSSFLLFLSLLCDLQIFGIATLIQPLWRTFSVTETWGLIHCHERRNNTGVVQGVVKWEGGSGAVETNIAPFIPALPDMGQHKAQHCLNPSTAVLLGTVVTFWLWKSVHFLPSLHILSWKWNSTKTLVSMCSCIGGICTTASLSEELRGKLFGTECCFSMC